MCWGGGGGDLAFVIVRENKICLPFERYLHSRTVKLLHTKKNEELGRECATQLRVIVFFLNNFPSLLLLLFF